TTHNPEMVKHVDLSDIILITRDKDGFSRLRCPSAEKEIKDFVEDEIGLEKLFIQNCLWIECANAGCISLSRGMTTNGSSHVSLSPFSLHGTGLSGSSSLPA